MSARFVILVAVALAVGPGTADEVSAQALFAPQSAASAANPLAKRSLESLSATRERPLFSPSRRPPSLPLAPPAIVTREAPPQEVPPPSISLFGVVSDPEGMRALIKLSTNQMRRVRVGDEISGWTVSQIEPRRLTLTLDKRTAVFVLFGDREMRQEPSGRQRA